jgi:pimeloyl-ACP methyl ester carboxylesterase
MVQKAYVDTAEGQVHYRYAGEDNDGPAIVLFHQNPSSSRTFEEVMAALAGEFHLVAPDMPGYGQSYAPDSVSDFGYYTRVLTAALDEVGIGNCHVVGHHTGAGVGVEFATTRPGQTETVTLIGPPYFTQAEREQLLEEAYGENPVPAIRPDGRHLLEHWELFDGESASPEIKHRMVVEALLARTGNEQSHAVGRDQAFPTLFEAIEAPRMLVCAPEDILWEAFERAREAHPEVRAVEVGGGSWEPVRDPDTVAAELRAFLAENGY